MDSLTFHALCLRLDRADGVALGLTSHDRALRLSGFDYRPHPGLSVSTIRQTGGLEPGGLDLSGGLSSADLTDADLLTGRWNDAQVRLWRVDWRAPDDAAVLLFTGQLGAVTLSAGRYKAEVLEARAALTAPIPRTSPGCRARFCDAACGLNAARFSAAATVSAINGAAITLDLPSTRLPDFIGGRLRWIDGPMRGIWQDIAAVEGGALLLNAPPMLPIDTPARVALVEGCDHSLPTCATRFANAANFRGEPHLPSMDLITRYPGG